VLATCGIRPPDESFENTQSPLLLLADFEEEEDHLKHSPAHLYKGGTSTVHGILTSIKRMTSLCLQSLHHRFLDWTKPSTPFLVLGTLTDLTKSKSELVAENALLRKPLIVLRRQVKRPACAKTDRILLVLLARMVRTWKQALFLVEAETDLALASSGIQTLLEIPVPRDAQRAALSPELASPARSKLSLLSERGSEISHPYGKRRATKDSQKLLH
jgi:hypothetical protein